MTNKQLLDLLGEMGDRHVLAPDQAPRARKRRPVRTALIAACVCAAVVGSAVAAGTGIFDFVGTLFGNSNDAQYTVIPEIIRYPISSFSAEFQQWTSESGHDPIKYFDSFDEMEDFTGIEIYDNSILSGACEEQINTLSFDKGENGIAEAVGCTTNYSIEPGLSLTVGVTIYTENAEESPELRYHHIMDGNTVELTREDYVTSGGLPVVIVTSTSNESASAMETRYYSAHFILHGMNYFIVADGSDSGLQTLKLVLDAFE